MMIATEKMIATDKMPFVTGDLVVYPTHGVGKITAIEEQEIAGHTLNVFNPHQGGFPSRINNLFCQPLKSLVMDRLIREHVGRCFELDSTKSFQPTPYFNPAAGLLGGQIK